MAKQQKNVEEKEKKRKEESKIKKNMKRTDWAREPEKKVWKVVYILLYK